MKPIDSKFKNIDLSFGIDQSLNSTAWCAVAPSGELLDYNLIRVNPSTNSKNKKLETPILDPALSQHVDPEEWRDLGKIWQQFYLAKVVSSSVSAQLSKFQFANGFMDGQNIVNVCIEGLGMGASGDATRGLAGLQFLIIDEIMRDADDWGNPNRERISIDIVPPTTLKKFATGNGRADKDALFDCLPDPVKDEFSKIPKSKGRMDLVDAYWISLYGYEARKKDET